MEILAVIPARGGSKGVPRKNIRNLCGKPLISYSIDSAHKSAAITRVVVSTDDPAIAKVAIANDAEIRFLRPACLATDDTPDLPVFEHCLATLASQERYRPDIVVHLRPTTPFRTAKHIDEAVACLLKSPELDSVRSVCEAPCHPLKMWRLGSQHFLSPFVPESVHGIPEPYNKPRQILPVAYIQNAAIDVVRANVILTKHSMTGQRIGAYLMEPLDSVDIDGEIDWMFAEWMLEKGMIPTIGSNSMQGKSGK